MALANAHGGSNHHVHVDVRNVEPVRAFLLGVSELRSAYTELAIRAGATEEGRTLSRVADDLELLLTELDLASDS